MSQADLSLLEKQLQAKADELARYDREIAERREALEKLKDSERQRPLRSSEEPLRGERPWSFQVLGLRADDRLPTKTFECCDESEALRCYAATTPDPRFPNKQIDLVKFKVRVVCLNAADREAARQLDVRIATARAKFLGGLTLSKEEAKLLENMPVLS